MIYEHFYLDRDVFASGYGGEARIIKFREGETSLQVIQKIVDQNPNIELVNLVFYDFEDNSSNGTFEPNSNIWIPVNMLDRDFLLSLSNANFDIDPNGRMMAVSSKVMLTNGAIRHFQMMDFANLNFLRLENAETDCNEALMISAFSGTPGVFINSGASYHFIGSSLLKDAQWYRMLENRLHEEDKRYTASQLPLYDRGFIQGSLQRGYSALRLFGYPDTEKSVEPKVCFLD